MTMSDLTYTNDGTFARFMPQSKAGEDAWREIAAHCGGVANIPLHHLPSTLAQLRKAGFSVRKASTRRESMSSDEILDAIMAKQGV